ncbi:MAG: glycosyltransferase family 1 protein [Acidobacteria bacterium]|nr:MAG: glycosyltransferase family 1 protein [Acidobacteriota bacterium]GIU81331.1 MAG: glycoside hydrolase [Pyrinomonadaceae bacterium]
MKIPRVAFFPDSFLEVNGVAMTSKRFADYAQKNGYPFLCVYAGEKSEEKIQGSITYLCLKRSAVSIPMDEGLKYDPLFQRHQKLVMRKLQEFQPDLVHITGLNDVSILGAFLAWKMNLPLVGSWHTNLHEYAARRFKKMFRFLPEKIVKPIADLMERKILQGATLYYKMPQMILAPNQEILDILTKGTGRKGKLMLRGVDTDFFSPQKRTVSDDVFRFGYVGRLRPEKNLRILVKIEEKLIQSGANNFRFVIVGEGSEREWLEKNLKTAELTGFLEGEALANSYANMDVFLFPSETDAFGNVVQEANASGIPAVVMDKGGPKFLIKHGENGFIARNEEEFVDFSLKLFEDRKELQKMKEKARENVIQKNWDSIFESVYEAYQETIMLFCKPKFVKI